MNRTLENERLLIEVAERGSELVRVYDKKNQCEVLWNGDPAVWPKHSPLLFPMVGQSYGDKYRHEGKVYEMPSHGFSWTSMFTFVEEGAVAKDTAENTEKNAAGKADTVKSAAAEDASVGSGMDGNVLTAVLTDSEETRKCYPFPFRLAVTHRLSGNRILVSWKVTNTGSGVMYYNIGAHPAFRMRPGKKSSDMYLKFAGKDSLDYIQIQVDGSYCAMPETVCRMPLDDGCIRITEGFWDKGVYIFEHQGIEELALLHEDKTPFVTVYCKGFPYVGVWTKPGAPFVCLEPWHGRCDNHGYEGELKDKTGVLSLEAGKSDEYTYVIEFE